MYETVMYNDNHKMLWSAFLKFNINRKNFVEIPEKPKIHKAITAL